ncbi:hypothetical protein QHL1GM_11245 [Halomonas sp. QHL1]|nr:hypothetical protein QHL1GM_11245 [Halomonas sp. QHL1]
MTGEGATTGAGLDIGNGTLWVKGWFHYITFQVSGLAVFLGTRFTDLGLRLIGHTKTCVG